MSNVVESEAAGTRGVSPWTWVPVLYFLQSLPNVLVTSLSLYALQKVGFDQLQFLPWLGLAALPWTLKLLWAPLVDLSAKKRTWVLVLQPVTVVLILAVAWVFWIGAGTLWWIIVLMGAVALASATHDIAADGYYLLALQKDQQARFVGVLTTSGRLAKLFCQFVLLYLVGVLLERGKPPSEAWAITLVVLAGVYALGAIIDFFVLKDVEPVREGSRDVRPHLARTGAMILAGLVLYFLLAGAVRIVGHYGGPSMGVPVKWMQEPGALRVWQMVAVGCALALVPCWLMASKMLRGSEIGTAMGTYIRQPKFGSILFFIITYRIGEAMLSSMSGLFLQDDVARGGMGLNPKVIAGITGWAGIGGIIFGGLVGGWYIAKVGLRRAFWPLAVVMHLPNLLFVYAAYERPGTWLLYPIMFVDQAGYGFGFAAYFVYLMYVAQRTPEFRTTHYAIGTGLGALIVSTLAPALSAILQSRFGYTGFFIACCVATIPGMIALLMIPLEEKKPEEMAEAGK